MAGEKIEQHYSGIGKTLQKFYILRCALAYLLFAAALLYSNLALTPGLHLYPDSSPQISQKHLDSLLLNSKSTLLSLTATLAYTATHPVKTDKTNYCTSNMSFEDCVSWMGSVSEQLTESRLGTSTAFRCVMGSCKVFGPLWNYLWQVKVRLPEVESLTVKYTSQDGVQRLVAPFLAEENILEWKGEQIVTVKKGILMIGRSIKIQNNSLSVLLTFNSTLLLALNIDPSLISLQTFLLNLPTPTFSLTTLPYRLSTLACLGVGCLFLCILLRMLIQSWQKTYFGHLQTLTSLYCYQLNQIFLGSRPKNSAILPRCAVSSFYQQLAQLVDKDYQSLQLRPPTPQKEEPFRFPLLIDRIMSKFEEYIRPLQQQRSRQLSNFKYLIKTAVGQIGESTGRKLKQLFQRARQLSLGKAFFHFGYLSLLSSSQQYDKILQQQVIALPQAMVNLFRYMNRTVTSQQIRYAFKFAFIFQTQVIQQQLIMKIHFSLLQKYFMSLRELDFGLGHARGLGLERQLRYLQDAIDNKKHIFNTYLK